MIAFLILLFFAILFLVAGGVLLYFRNRTKHKSALMSQTETSNASDVSGIAPGTLVEVKGMLRCDEPLTSEMAERTCAYYSSTVTREYLRPDYDDDDNDVGSDRRTEIIAQNVQFAPFVVEDDTGFVGVHAEGAEIDARQVVNRFDRNTGNEANVLARRDDRQPQRRRAHHRLPLHREHPPRRRARFTCSAPCRKEVASAPHRQTRRTTDLSSAIARKRPTPKASARPPSGSAWEAPPPWSSAWSFWSWA